MSSSFANPFSGFRIVLVDASVPKIIKLSQVKFGMGKILFRFLAIPLGCFFAVLRRALTVGKHESEIILRERRPLLGGLEVPFHGLHQILFCAKAVAVYHAEIVLRLRISL